MHLKNSKRLPILSIRELFEPLIDCPVVLLNTSQLLSVEPIDPIRLKPGHFFLSHVGSHPKLPNNENCVAPEKPTILHGYI
jgi:hypothetical protein